MQTPSLQHPTKNRTLARVPTTKQTIQLFLSISSIHPLTSILIINIDINRVRIGRRRHRGGSLRPTTIAAFGTGARGDKAHGGAGLSLQRGHGVCVRIGLRVCVAVRLGRLLLAFAAGDGLGGDEIDVRAGVLLSG